MTVREAIRIAATDPNLVRLRHDFAAFAAKTFLDAGKELHVFGHMLGTDRREGLSPFGHGDDTAVAVSMLLRIGGQLISASADLIGDGRGYAGAALIRQLVEIEYLAWAFATKDEAATRWLRSSREERRDIFTPAKLRKAADGKFRGVDYGYHCELGGHPAPDSWVLLNDENPTAQLILSDCLGHTGQIWNHVVDWGRGTMFGEAILKRSEEMVRRFNHWHASDPLTLLPPPPAN